MNRTVTVGLWAVLLCAASSARGATLFERSLVVDRSVNFYTSSNFDLHFDLFNGSFFSPSNVVTLFNGLSITPASVGNVFEANAGSDAGFASSAARMTDALNQSIRMLFTESSSARSEMRGWSESGFFIGKSTPQHPDLAGATIDAIRLKVDQFTLDFSQAPAANPPVNLLLTFTVVGTPVPEPPSLTLAGGSLAIVAGAAYTVARRRRAALVAARVPHFQFPRTEFPHIHRRRDYGMALRAND